MHIYVDGKTDKRDRFCTNLPLTIEEAIAVMRKVSARDGWHVTSECNIKRLFKDVLDEDISATALLTIIHVPTSHQDVVTMSDTRTLLFPINIVFTWFPNRCMTRVEAVDPLTRGARSDDSLRPVVRKARKTLKRLLKELDREAMSQAAALHTDAGAA